MAMGQTVAAAQTACSPNNTSPECNPVTPPVFEPGSACKFSGASCDGYFQAYRAVFCMTNNTDDAVVVTISNLQVNGEDYEGVPNSVEVPPTGQSFCFYVIADDTGNSANGTLTFTYSYSYVDEFGVSIPVTGTATTGNNDLPPCDDCSDEYGVPGEPLDPANDEAPADTSGQASNVETEIQDVDNQEPETAQVSEPVQTEDTTVVEPAPEGEPAEAQTVDPAATSAEPQNG
ncbi:hypothetical protein ACQE98_09235 [Ornithinimicrobium sp. W1679]|uniref:hypothetical protein n=1 Tax=Ornithinimicrobium sp. W1679 TaxID=3418770 RepID=UPI003CEB8901